MPRSAAVLRLAAAGAAVAAWALAEPAGSVEVRAPASATITEATGVRMNWTMAMPSVQGGASGASFIGAMPSMGMAMMLMPRNSGLMVRREDATGAPVTAPASFEVIQNQGDEGLIVKTGGSGEIRVGRDAIAGGALIGGSAASIAVDRGVAMSVGDRAGAPVATDTLTIVVQYN